MDTLEIINRLEELIKNNNLDTTINSNDAKEETNGNPFKEFISLILSFFLNILKTPFKLVAKYVTNLFIAVGVGVYFYDHGLPVFTSILYSIVFQLISFIVIAILAYISMKSIKSLRLLVEISKN